MEAGAVEAEAPAAEAGAVLDGADGLRGGGRGGAGSG
jgi:hypothetical protein